MLFQSTLPLRGATRVHVRDAVLDLDVISIHTPLAGSDDIGDAFNSFAVCYFNPHSPCGERRGGLTVLSERELFQSTLPLRGATNTFQGSERTRRISIHTPLAGSDLIPSTCIRLTQFQSTLPLRGATGRAYVLPFYNKFQSTLPLRGATIGGFEHFVPAEISIHTPLAGSDITLTVVSED